MRIVLDHQERMEFERRWPGASAYLVHCELVHELRDLKRELENANDFYMYPGRRDWITKRIADLECLGTLK